MTRTAAPLVQRRTDGEPASPNVPTPLLRPRIGRQIVDRPRVQALLDARRRRPTDLISAPPGGARRLQSLSWLAAQPDRGRVVWLSLSERDNNPRTFWHRIAAGVATVRRTRRPRLSRQPRRRSSQCSSRPSRTRSPSLLVLDDFHLVRNPDLLAPFAQLLTVAPEQLRVVIASRSDPDLEIHRLRLYGDLTEIRARELAFTQEEAEAFFATAGVSLQATQVETLVRRTEGWAAGLRFAALSLLGQGDVAPFVNRFDDSERAASDYLLNEVLAHQDQPTRDFLLKTAACDRISGALADALTGRTDGERVLAELERRNLFLVREPGGRGIGITGSLPSSCAPRQRMSTETMSGPLTVMPPPGWLRRGVRSRRSGTQLPVRTTS